MGTPVIPTGRIAVFGTVEHLGVIPGEGILPREVIVWLPPAYDDEPDRRFPVLYMHDGHNAVDPATSYAGEDWQIDDVAIQMIEADRIRPFILVGPYATDDRFEEYGADFDRGRAYLRWLTQDLKQLVDARFRTLPGREDTFTMGSSMGGHISFMAVGFHLDVFGGAAMMSPYFSPESIAALDALAEWPSEPLRLYMDNGGDELDESFQPDIDTVLEVLSTRPGIVGPTWFRDEGAPHHESAWAHRVWRALDVLFGT